MTVNSSLHYLLGLYSRCFLLVMFLLLFLSISSFSPTQLQLHAMTTILPLRPLRVATLISLVSRDFRFHFEQHLSNQYNSMSDTKVVGKYFRSSKG